MTPATMSNAEPPAVSVSGAQRTATVRYHRRRSALEWCLRLLGSIDLLALAAVVLPTPWMAAVHQSLGLGELPSGAVVSYLTRSASLLYALHGAMIVFVSFDVGRYSPLIKFLVGAALVHGAALVAIDATAKMPLWWTLLEGPGYGVLALVTLVLVYRFERAGEAHGAALDLPVDSRAAKLDQKAR